MILLIFLCKSFSFVQMTKWNEGGSKNNSNLLLRYYPNIRNESRVDWILTQIFLAITNLCIERKKKRIKFFSFAIREIFQPHRFLSICPSSTTSLLSRCQLETPFLFHRHLADGRSFRPTTWHRLPSSKFEDGNVAEDGKKELTKRYSLSLSHTHIYIGAESFPIMVEAEMRTNVPPPRFRLSATSASTTTFRIPKYRSRNKLNAIPVSRISY